MLWKQAPFFPLVPHLSLQPVEDSVTIPVGYEQESGVREEGVREHRFFPERGGLGLLRASELKMAA